MDQYSIYWMKDEIAVLYFHKTDILYRFIKQYKNNKDRMDLRLQYDYITNDFLHEHLIYHFKKFHSSDLSIKVDGRKVHIKKKEQILTLQINRDYLQFRCSSLKDAEELLFPILRDYESSLFVSGDNIVNYGWISPLKNSKKYIARELLYSIR